MEFSFWSIVIGLVIGALLGAGIVWLAKSRSTQSSSAAQLRREHESFKDEVTEHFVQTGELVNQLTDSYKEVIDHLRRGADQLVEPETLERRLPSSNNSAVTVQRIGAHEEGGQSTQSLRHDDGAAEPKTDPERPAQQTRDAEQEGRQSKPE